LTKTQSPDIILFEDFTDDYINIKCEIFHG